MSGWFSVKRGITTHPIFKGYPERLAIWLWLIDNAAWKDTPHDVNGKTIMVKRGSVCASERRLAEEIGVGRQVIRTFLERLKADHMINAEITHGRTLITICNYNKYQSPQSGHNPPPNPPLTQDQPTKEQGNNITVSSLRSDTAHSGDLTKLVFDAGTALLVASGMAPARAKSMLGKWRKDHGDASVIAAIGKAQREGAINPVEYINGIFRKASPAASGEFGAFGRIREVH